MTTIYQATKMDFRHKHLGIYVDVANCFELPVGPFPSRESAQAWVNENSARLEELYGNADAH